VLESNEFYMVTEPVEGQTLREYLNSVGSPSEKNAVMIARQTAEGLEAAHAAGVQHRNLNLTNIIITSSAENGLLVKIHNFDFGNVRQMAASATFDSEPHLDWLRYSSPEQCAAQTTDVRSDIYSLGVVLYEMLEERPPFDAPDAAELIHKQINEQPQPAKISNFDIRALLTHTLMLALQKNPARRLPSANAFVRQLRHIEQLVTRSPIPVQTFERLSAPNTTSNSVQIIEKNAFAAKFGSSFFEELQPSAQVIAETVTINSSEAEQVDLLKETVLEDKVVENVSPAQSELIFVKQKKAVDSQLASEFSSEESKLAEDTPSERETVQAEREEFDYAEFASEPLRFEDEFDDLSEPESVISPAASIEETLTQPAKANLLFSHSAGNELRQSMMLSRPILAGAGFALFISAIIGIALNEKFQLAASQPLTAAAPVLEPASIPKSEEQTLTASKDTAITKESEIETEEPETEEADVSDSRKYTPVKFDKPEPATPSRGNKSQPLKIQPPKEETVSKTKTKQNTTPDKKLVSEERTTNKTKAKQNTTPDKKLAPKKQISVLTESDIFKRPRVVKDGSARRKN